MKRWLSKEGTINKVQRFVLQLHVMHGRHIPLCMSKKDEETKILRYKLCPINLELKCCNDFLTVVMYIITCH